VKQVTIATAVGILLLSLGVFQIIAALLAVFFWSVAGDWREFVPQIVIVAFWLNFPATYWIWRRWFQRSEANN
jgi:hypothetical protein